MDAQGLYPCWGPWHPQLPALPTCTGRGWLAWVSPQGVPTPTAPLLGPRQSPRGDRRGGPGSPPQLRELQMLLRQRSRWRPRHPGAEAAEPVPGEGRALGRPGERNCGGHVCVTGGDAGSVTSRVCSEA